jgi:hypothetical protein
MKSSAPKIVGSILKKTARKKSLGGTANQTDAPAKTITPVKGSNKRKRQTTSDNPPERQSKQRANRQKKKKRTPNSQNSQHQSQPSDGRGGKPTGNAKGKGSKTKGTNERK